ncbi:hypothetical protein Peur_054928 [Populus x canadensis]
MIWVLNSSLNRFYICFEVLKHYCHLLSMYACMVPELCTLQSHVVMPVVYWPITCRYFCILFGSLSGSFAW